ncbi:hypothetical protein MRX96_003169 [Rhipicephalus microplus]
MSTPVACSISVLETHLDPSLWVLQVSRSSLVSRQPRRRPSIASAYRRVDGYVGFSGATIKPLALGQEALAIAHRRHCAEVGTSRWPERASALGRWSR